ncbi:hypothetical protein [Aliarcobacter butzleri]|uniref:hypothetical protein n=1 Tax=Aliarcobacter butzleri TaxID=28197 RepID=UPI00344FA624
MSDKINKPGKKRVGLPPRLEISLKNADSNLKKIQEALLKLNLRNFDDTIALEQILKVLDANIEVKAERRSKQIRGEKQFKINAEYNVFFANDLVSKTLFRLLKSIKQVNDNEMSNIQQKFLNNNVEDLVGTLNSSKLLISDTTEVIKIISNSFKAKGAYEKNSLFNEINKLSISENKE